MILNSRSDGQLPDTTSVYKDMLRIHGKLLKYRYVDDIQSPAEFQISCERDRRSEKSCF
jgi:hypothetical protein